MKKKEIKIFHIGDDVSDIRPINRLLPEVLIEHRKNPSDAWTTLTEIEISFHLITVSIPQENFSKNEYVTFIQQISEKPFPSIEEAHIYALIDLYSPALTENLYELGVDMVFTTPISPATILSEISNLIDN